MNYIHQLNAFDAWASINCPSTAQYALYHALLAINNKCGWKEWFACPNSLIESRASISKMGINKARKYLADNNLIQIEMRSGNQATLYKILPIGQIVDANVYSGQIVDANEDAKLTQMVTIPKQRTQEEEEEKGKPKTAMDAYIFSFKKLSYTGHIQGYVAELLKKGFTDSFIREVFLEMGARGANPDERYMRKLAEDWISKGIYTRAEAERRKNVPKNVIPLKPKQDIEHLPTAAEIKAAEEERMQRSREERDLMFER